MQAENMARDAKTCDIQSRSQNNIRILIVEKNPVDAAIGQKLIKILHHQNTVIATSDKTAIKLFPTFHFGMVIIGIGLSDASEIELYAQLCSLHLNEHIPISGKAWN